jgi:hypothetical protein
MSTNQQEQKYFERLNISVLTISRIKELIKTDIKNTLNAWNKGKMVERQCFHIIGPAGVGKTEVMKQITDELTIELKRQFNLIIVKAPVLSRDDFIIPFPITDNGNISFKMLYSDFVPKDPDSYGLFVIDEFSRGDHSLQQLLWQVQNEYKVHLMDFPRHWFVISIDNPDDSEYQLDSMEDAAGLRRQLHIYTEVNTPDFLKYAIENNFHETVIEFIQTHPDYLYDWDSQKLGAVYANPASYEKLSHHMWKFELNNGIERHYDDIEALASGLLNVAKARLFIEFIREGKDINPKDIVFDYKKVRPKILQFLKDNDNASLGNIMTSFVTYLTTSKPKYLDKEKENIAKFLVDMPLDSSALYVTIMDNLDRGSSEFMYVTNLHVELLKNPDYKHLFYESIVRCGRDKT